MTDLFDIIIVGGGSAGIGAARTVEKAGLTCLLLEASGRLGGRAWTHRQDGLAVDLGCGWLHSGDRNPWTAIAEASGFTVDRTESAWRNETAGRGMTVADSDAADGAYAAWAARLHRAPPVSDRASDALYPACRWNNYINVLSCYINGAPLDQLSVADFLAYDDAASDTNWRVREGYGTLVAASLPRIAAAPATVVRLETPVATIDHGRAAVVLTTPAGCVTAKAVIVTVSTTQLAKGAIRFSAAIDEHLHAASTLPLGLANKLFFKIEPGGPFAAETYSIGNPHSPVTGGYYVMPFGQAVIEAYFGGDGADQIEREGTDAAFDRALDELVALYGSDVRQFLRPLVSSAWKNTPWIGGSYSHALPGCAGQRQNLARPVDNRLFFAGEATHPTDFSTAHGALESGIRAATEAIAALKSA